MRRTLMLLLLALLVGVLVGSRFYPRITHIEVAGAEHYTAAEIAALAGLEPGQPLLWVTTWGLSELRDDPWIEHARVVRRWPNRVSVEVTERTPALRQGESVYALDGTVLPDATPLKSPLVTLEGWGADRTGEAVELLRLLADFRPEVLSYSPSGFTVFFADSSLYTPDVASLRAHWSGFVEQRGFSVAVYPWGVSVRP